MRVAFATALSALAVSPAGATLQFQKVFVQEHIADHPDREFAQFVERKAKCNICHQGTKDRTQHNRYGEELARLLNHRADKEDVAKVVAALRTVAELPADPSKPGGGTFGDRIVAGKLPAGDLDELKTERAK
jgi:hypothetical protein